MYMSHGLKGIKMIKKTASPKTSHIKSFFTLTLITLFMLPHSIMAQEVSPNTTHSISPVYKSVDKDDLWQTYLRAREFDAEFLRATQEYGAAKEGLNQARGRLLPEVSIFAEEVETEQDIVASDITVFGSGNSDYSTTRYGININQPVFDWERFMGYSQAKRQDAQADAVLLQAQQSLILKVAENYLLVLAAQDNLEFTRKEEKAVLEQKAIAAARFKAKLGRKADFLEAKARAVSVYADRIAAENSLDDAIEGIREISGAGSQNYSRLIDQFKLVSAQPDDLDVWIDKSMKGNIEIQMQRYAVKVAQYEIKRLRAGHYPTLDLFARFNNEDKGGSLFGGTSEVDTTEIGLRLNVPIFEGGSTNSRVKEAAFNYNAALEQQNQQMRKVRREARSTFLDLRTSLTKVDSLQQAVEAQNVVVDTKRKGYPRLYTSREVLDSERDLYSAKRDLAKARYEYLLANLKLKATVGSLTGKDLENMNSLFL